MNETGRTEAGNVAETSGLGRALRFERETCSRCGGSGSYSYCQRFGSVCFKCSGRKEVLTKRGHAASLYLKSLRSRPAVELKPGDQIKHFGMTMGGDSFPAWFTVESIGPCDNPGRSFINNAEQPRRDDLLTIDCTSKKAGPLRMIGVEPERPFEVALPAEQHRATLEAAIAYQETLTRAGMPRKRAQKKLYPDS